jgi:CheY-like chemotaxis protein
MVLAVNVLILDDKKDSDLALMRDAAIELGHQVTSTDDPAEFLSASETKHPDLLIVDHNLPGIEQQVGMRDGLELVALSAARSAHVPSVLFTNYTGDCSQRLSEFDPRLMATMVQKPLGHSKQDWLHKLGAAINSVTSDVAPKHPPRLGVPVAELNSSFFKLSPSELHTLSEQGREELEIEASDELHPLLTSAWEACEDDWLMVLRIGGTVMIVDRGLDATLPTIDSIRETELDRTSGILTIGRPMFLEETGVLTPTDCTPAPPRNWARYPHVRLIVGPHERDFHLDTGSARSYISHDFVVDALQVPLRNPKPSKIWNLGSSVTRMQQPVDLDLHVVGPKGNVRLSLTMHAVRRWRSFKMINPPCIGQACPDSFKDQCGRRLGLLGRDLLYSVPEGDWAFDTESGQFYALGS